MMIETEAPTTAITPVEINPESISDMLFAPGLANTLHPDREEDVQLKKYTESIIVPILIDTNVIQAWKEFGLLEGNYKNIIEHNVMSATMGYITGTYMGLT